MFQEAGNQPMMSTQMSAVMTIISACGDLGAVASPFINIKLERIEWDPIFKQRWSLSQKTALAWAYAFWRDETRPRFNLFESSTLMDEKMQIAVLKAAMIRWGFGRKAISMFDQQAINLVSMK